MSQPPQNPPPGEEPWQQPSGGRYPDRPYSGGPASGRSGGSHQEPPPFDGTYGGLPPYPPPSQPPPGGGFGGSPGHPGGQGGYADPAAGLASRGARLGAAIIDTGLLIIVIGLLAWPFVDYGRVFKDAEGNVTYLPTGQWGANLLSVVAAFLYYWLPTYTWGQTLGKKALGIQVVRAGDGGPVTQGQAAGRAGFYTVLGGLCGCIGLIDVLWILGDPRRQALHDKVAQTVVRKVEPGAPDPYARR